MTIPHTAPPPGDYRVTVARQALAEMPEIAGIEEPYFWLGRLKTALQLLADGWPDGTQGGLDHGQREVLGQALADAIAHRDPAGLCPECDGRPEGLCNDHAADLDLTDAYLALGRELGIEVGA
jgi:hypothetical protein